MARQRDPLPTVQVVEGPGFSTSATNSKISDTETAVGRGTDCDSVGSGFVRWEPVVECSSSISDVQGPSKSSKRRRPEITHDRSGAFHVWQHESWEHANVDRHYFCLVNSSRTHSEIMESDSANHSHHYFHQAEAPAGNGVAYTSRTDMRPGNSPDDLAFNHKMAERKRRKKQKDSLQMLKQLLPHITKKNKASVLGHTVDYLKQLTAERQQLLERKRILQAVLEQNDLELVRLQSSTKDNSGH